MKKILYILLLLPLFVHAQDEKPPAGLINVFNTFYVTADGQLWIYKGPAKGWNRMARYSDLLVAGSGSANVRTNAQQDSATAANYFNKTQTVTFLNGKADTGYYVKRTVGVIHLKDVPTMMAYTGQATTVIVDAPNSGGIFVANPAIVVTNYYNRIASAKGGAWVRQADMSKGIPVLWDYRIKIDALYDPYAKSIAPGYTDNAPYINQMIGSVAKGSIHLLFPRTPLPYYIGCASPVYLRQNTHLEGQGAFFPLQIITGPDSVRFTPLTGVAFGLSHGIRTAQDSAYRMQGVVVEHMTIVGPDKAAGNFSGISLPASGNGANPGVSQWHDLHVYGFRTSIDFLKGSDPHLDNVFVQYSQMGWRNGASAMRVTNSNIFECDTAGSIKGDLANIDNTPINNCKYGLYCDSLVGSNFGSGMHFFAIDHDMLTFRSGCNGNTISGHYAQPAQHAITFYYSGRNAVLGAAIEFAVVSPIYATHTNNLYLANNTISTPLNANHNSIELDTCSAFTIDVNNNGTYGFNRKIGLPGSTAASLPEYYSSIRLRGSAQSTDGVAIVGYNGGTSIANPSLLASNKTVVSINANAYNGSAETQVGKVAIVSNETHSATALGTRYDMSLIRNGTTAVSTVMSVDGKGYTFTGASNSFRHTTATFSGYDGEYVSAVNSSKNYDQTFFPTGPNTATRLRLSNDSSKTNYSGLVVGLNKDTATVSAQANGTPLNTIAALNIGGTDPVIGGGSFPIINIRTSALNLPRATRLPINGLIKGNGAGTNISQAVDGTDYVSPATLAQSTAFIQNQNAVTQTGSFKVTGAPSANGFNVYDAGGSYTTPSFKATGTTLGLNNGFSLQVYNGTAAGNVVQFAGLTTEAHAPGALGTDAAIYATVAGTAAPRLAAQISGDGRLRLLRDGRLSGDILTLNGGYFDNLHPGTNGQTLTISGGLPAWVTPNFAMPRGHVVMSVSVTGILNYDYLNTTTSTYTITVPATTGFAADGSSIITALQTGTGTIRIACPTGYTLTTPSGQVTPSTGYASIAQNQKVQLIPIGANAWYIQPLNGSITVN
jgi:hypothetical protein